MKEDILAVLLNPLTQKFLIVAFVSNAFDFITGFSKAWSNQNIQSSKLRKGITKFIEYIAFISIGILLDFVLIDFMAGVQGFTIAFCLAITSIEIKSIAENFSETKLKKMLEKSSAVFENKTKQLEFDEILKNNNEDKNPYKDEYENKEEYTEEITTEE